MSEDGKKEWFVNPLTEAFYCFNTDKDPRVMSNKNYKGRKPLYNSTTYKVIEGVEEKKGGIDEERT